MRHAFPWLSPLLLLLANLAFGLFLHRNSASEVVWMSAIAYIIFECAVLSIIWHPFRDFVLQRFKSDMGYTIAAFLGASFAVVLAVWAYISSYFLVMLAAGLLLRVDLFTRRIGKRLTFAALATTSAVGIALSWVVVLLPVWFPRLFPRWF
ncbi:MAG: hypothetical protein AAFR25_01355 [Cyanobacteria bacterium J06629_19]